MIIAGGIYGAHLPHWQVRQVDVVGATALNTQKISASALDALQGSYAFIIPKRMILAADTAAVSRTLRAAFPLIRSLSIEKKFPDALAVYLEERTLFGVLCTGASSDSPGSAATSTALIPASPSSCAYVDHDGVAYAAAPATEGSLILKIETDAPDIPLGAVALDQNTIQQIIYLADHLRPATGLAPSEFIISTAVTSEIHIRVGDGFLLLLKKNDDLAAVLKVVRRVLDGKIGAARRSLDYIDARFNNKVFYKMK